MSEDDFARDVPPELAGAILTVDLGAIAANWRALRDRHGTDCAGVVKADAYGLGLGPVARVLARAGCRVFCVAMPEEGLRLRRILPDATILVLSGPLPGGEGLFAAHALVPILNSLEQVAAWRAHAPAGAAYGLHVDTGMNRLGLPLADVDALPADFAPGWLLSHLACADEPGHALNAGQLAAFRALRARFPGAVASLANSAGLLLGRDYAFDLGRPGIGVYGGHPCPGHGPNPMAPVVRLDARIVQVRRVDTPQTVGYGASHRCEGGSLLATVAAGYADGLPRTLSNRGRGMLGEQLVPMVGRVSMDLTVFDVTAAGPDLARPGAFITLIGPHHSVDDLAAEAGTIPYEILTALGRRHARRHIGG